MRVGRLWDSIRRRFGFGHADQEDGQERTSTGPRLPMPRARRTGFLNVDAFAGELVRIKDGVAEPQPHLHVFSLSDFRRAVGNKWDRLGGLVEVAVESIIRRHVDAEKDIFTRLDAEVACLALPEATRAETRTRVAAIARDISAHLFGDAVIDGRRPQVLAANLPLDDALTDDGLMDRQAIDHALAKAGAALAAGLAGEGAGGAAAAAMAAPHRATLASLMTPEDAALMAEEARKKKGPAYSISGGERTTVSEPKWFIPQDEGPRGADAPRQVMTLSSSRGGADAKGEVMAASAKLGGADAPRQTLVVSSKRGGADAKGEVMAASAKLGGADAPRQTLVVSSKRGGADTKGEVMAAPPRLNGADAERATARFAQERAQQAVADWFEPTAPRPLAGADAERRVLNLAKEVKPRAPEEVMRVDGGGGGHHESGLSPESALTLVWTPTWVTSRRAIGAFHARIIRSDKEGAPTLEGVHAYDDLSPIEVLTLDRFTATQAARELKSLFYARQKIGLTVPVHWMSLSPKWRDCIRIPFEDCPGEARRKFLKIEVFGLSHAIPAVILRRMFEPLEKIGCDVMARLPLAAADMIPALSHLRAVGVDLAELADDERVGDDELFTRLDGFRLAAKQAKVATYVWGVRRRPLIAKVVSSGFSLVNGPGVMCDLSRPVLPSHGGVPS